MDDIFNINMEEIQTAELIIENNNNIKQTNLKCILINFSIIFSLGIILTILSIILAYMIDDILIKVSVIVPLSMMALGLILGSVSYLVLSRNWRDKH
jgi:uncharacterized membrane protein